MGSWIPVQLLLKSGQYFFSSDVQFEIELNRASEVEMSFGDAFNPRAAY